MRLVKETPWQFGIRHLLVTTFFIAAASGMLAPWLRGWSAAEWIQLALQTLMTASSFVVITGLHGYARGSVIARLGSPRWEISFRSGKRRLGSRPRGALLIMTSILVLIAMAMANSASDEPYLSLSIGLVPALLLGILAAVGASELRFPDDRLLVSAWGVVVNSQTFPWDQVSLAEPTSSTAKRWTLTTATGRFDLDLDDEQGQTLAGMRQAALLRKAASSKTYEDREDAVVRRFAPDRNPPADEDAQ